MRIEIGRLIRCDVAPAQDRALVVKILLNPHAPYKIDFIFDLRK